MRSSLGHRGGGDGGVDVVTSISFNDPSHNQLTLKKKREGENKTQNKKGTTITQSVSTDAQRFLKSQIQS